MQWLCFSFVSSIAVQLNGKDLGHSAYSLGGASAEQQPRSGADEFRMLQEAKDDRRRIVGAHVFGTHETFHNGRLLDAADVHRRLEASMDGRRMKQDDYTGL